MMQPIRRLSDDRHVALAAALLLGVAWATACATGAGSPSATIRDDAGLAAVYDDSFQGHRTVSGELYDERKLTAAHASLPLGALIEVRRPDNDRRVVVRINDRPPKSTRAAIVLAKAAAAALDIDAGGRVPVEWRAAAAK
jgi:rare lipoprotein A (peptidoglycan hydrolase)